MSDARDGRDGDGGDGGRRRARVTEGRGTRARAPCDSVSTLLVIVASVDSGRRRAARSATRSIPAASAENASAGASRAGPKNISADRASRPPLAHCSRRSASDDHAKTRAMASRSALRRATAVIRSAYAARVGQAPCASGSYAHGCVLCRGVRPSTNRRLFGRRRAAPRGRDPGGARAGGSPRGWIPARVRVAPRIAERRDRRRRRRRRRRDRRLAGRRGDSTTSSSRNVAPRETNAASASPLVFSPPLDPIAL
jgi:hypothetical protein